MTHRLEVRQRLSFGCSVTELALCPGGFTRTLIDRRLMRLLRRTLRAFRESLIFTRATPALFALALPRARNLTLLLPRRSRSCRWEAARRARSQ